MTTAPHVHARRAIVARGRTHAVILSVTLVAIGTALGSFATSLLERRAAAAEPAGQATQSRGGSPLTDEAGSRVPCSVMPQASRSRTGPARSTSRQRDASATNTS